MIKGDFLNVCGKKDIFNVFHLADDGIVKLRRDGRCKGIGNGDSFSGDAKRNGDVRRMEKSNKRMEDLFFLCYI